MRLIFVRHAATANNENGLLQEDHAPLSKNGEKQAELVGKRLAKEKINHIYSSPHRRAKQTATEIAKHHNIDVVDNQDMRERGFGEFKGRPGKEYTHWWRTNGLSWAEAKPKHGESYQEVYIRTNKFIEDMKQKHSGETVVIVSHGGVITTTVLRLKGITDSKENFDNHSHKNTAVSIVNFGDDVEFEVVACIDHLPDELQTNHL